MKNALIAAALCIGMGSAAVTPAQAFGCLSGAAAGGVAGHVAGHHGFIGAAIGCAVGHHKAVMDRRARQRGYQQTSQQQPQQTQPNTTVQPQFRQQGTGR